MKNIFHHYYITNYFTIMDAIEFSNSQPVTRAHMSLELTHEMWTLYML